MSDRLPAAAEVVLSLMLQDRHLCGMRGLQRHQAAEHPD